MKPLFANIFGPPGTGKTTLGFTFPPPFFYARFDRRADDVIAAVREKFGDAAVQEKALIAPLLVTDRRELAGQYLKEVEALASEALKAGEGTFFVDGGNRWWDCVQDVKLPWLEDPNLTPDQVSALERKRRMTYGAANAYLGDILLALEDSSVQMVLTHHTKSVYTAKGEETDRVKPDYFKRVPYTATFEIIMVTSRPGDVSLTTIQAKALTLAGKVQQVLPAPDFYGLITTCKDDARVEGMMLPNPTFPLLYGLAMSRPLTGDTWSPPFLSLAKPSA